ncbi:hypothetical protein PGC08_02110 [Brevibacterium sp. BDJS002]|uniref:hypothetical protein n=1 Tax=Brevibacterium sp. BDJS002 TaxID=3020906 RepID=UPI0023071BDE|nr:hypothetical protein [Brevibacterium sp. BDJS002]WCE40519.1 hypothetical protein PGC08_02110 [Brevibacterium sp. BDJS002]
MYDKSDPRSQLAQSSSAPIGSDDIAAPETHVFTDPQTAVATDDGANVWSARGQNFLVRYVELDSKASLDWDESRGYVLISAIEQAAVEVNLGGDIVRLDGRGIIVVPPGKSRISAEGAVVVAAVLDTVDVSTGEEAVNAGSYEQPHPRVARLADDAPAPQDLTAYPLSDYPAEDGRFGTIFRTHTLMINFLDDQVGPRDPEKLSPHHHDDFEQGSLTIQGKWRHHIRTPWTTKQSQWREDVHTTVSGPSLTIIPPPTVHTSQGLGDGTNLMIDLFSPPRDDFAAKGWVVNAEDFPQ